MSIDNNDDDQFSKFQYLTKEKLFKFYLELMDQYKEEPSNISEDELEQRIETTSLHLILNYIRESINMLIDKRVEQRLKEQSKATSSNEIDIAPYEQRIRKLENDIRQHYKKHLLANFQMQSIKSQIRVFEIIEYEYEEMKEKLKYENGKFLDNDRKDNEILILRAENSNLKSTIDKIESSYKEKEIQYKNDTNKIQSLNNQIELLTQEMAQYKTMSMNLNLNQNPNISNIQINNHNSSGSSKWMIKQDDDHYHSIPKNHYESEKNDTSDHEGMKRFMSLKQLKQVKPKHKLTKETINTHCSNSSAKHIPIINNSTPNKINHQKNNSLNMKLADIKLEELGLPKNMVNFNSLNSNGIPSQTHKKDGKNYTKITHLIPNSRFPVSQRSQNNQQQISKLYLTNGKMTKMGNRSALSIRSASKGQ